MSVGDITSDDKGTGARFNDGKAPLELIPLALLADNMARGQWRIAMAALGTWQTGGDTDDLLTAYGRLGALREVAAEEARVFDFGRRKYAEWNWARGMPWQVPMACAARHLLALDAGEELDLDSGLPHRGHVACNLRMLMWYAEHYPEGDDRPAALREA